MYKNELEPVNELINAYGEKIVLKNLREQLKTEAENTYFVHVEWDLETVTDLINGYGDEFTLGELKEHLIEFMKLNGVEY